MTRAPSTETAPREAPRLTQEDVRRLLERPSEDSKAAVIEKIGRDFSPEKLSPTEMAIAEQIFRLLVGDSALRIRQAMAENLAGNPYLPHDLALTLARDVEAVATPVLTMSEVFSDQELLSLIENSEEVWRYLAIARRQSLSAKVSDALIGTDVPDVMKEVLDNSGAEIAESTYLKLIVHAAGDESIARRMARRKGLPLAVVEKLLHVVSGDLADRLQRTLPLDAEQLDAGLRHAGEETTLDLLALRSGRAETNTLVDQLYRTDRLSASLIINALCNGNVDFFEASLARLAGIPEENARMLVHDKGRLGFRALYNKSQLPLTMYKAVRLLLDSVRGAIDEGHQPGNHPFANRVVAMMLEASEHEQIDNLSYVLAIIRQRPAG